MNIERRTEAIVESWLDDDFPAQPDSGAMLRNVRAGVAETAQHHRRWWPFDRSARPLIPECGPSPARRFTMFTAIKFAVASLIVALAGGVLLTGILPTQPRPEMAPAALTESPSPSMTGEAAFPTGTLVSIENPSLLLTLNPDGTGEARDVFFGWDARFIYATHDDLYTEMYDDSTPGPATYFWDFDGENLTLESWGQDPDGTRNMFYEDNTWTPVEDPLVVVIAPRNVEAGERVPAMRAFVPATEAAADVFTATKDVVGRIAAAPISEGQPITPDVLEPAAE